MKPEPMSEDQILAEFAKLYPHDAALLKIAVENKNMGLESIGARHHWAAFLRGATATAAARDAAWQAVRDAARMEGVHSVHEQTAVIVRAALELLESIEGDAPFPAEKMRAFRRVFDGEGTRPRTYTQAELDAAVAQAVKDARASCAATVFVTSLEAQEEDADDLGVQGWLDLAEVRIRGGV